jgi:hypothetical protein
MDQSGPRLTSLALILSVVAAAGCGDGSEDDSTDVRDVGQGSVVARCKHAALGNGDPDWRDRSLVVGSLGFMLDGRDFRSAQKVPRDSFQASHPLPSTGPILGTKVPVVVEGGKPVEVSIAPADRERAGLVLAVEGGPYAEVRFVPCRGQTRTGWPGGWALRDREPVRVTVEEEGRPPSEVLVGGS